MLERVFYGKKAVKIRIRPKKAKMKKADLQTMQHTNREISDSLDSFLLKGCDSFEQFVAVCLQVEKFT